MSRTEKHRQRRQEMEQEGQAQPLRASYPPDPAEDMIARSQEDWAAYPDQVYQAQHAEEPDAPAPEEPSYFSQPVAAEGWAGGGMPRKPRNTALWTCIFLAALCVLALLLYLLYAMHAAYRPFRQQVTATQQEVFAPGVYVDNVRIGGMTRAQAEAALRQSGTNPAADLHITLNIDGQTWIMTSSELPFTQNLSAVLDTAYAIGRQGTVDTIGNAMTPFAYRYAHLNHTLTTPAYLNTEVTYDRAAVRELVAIIENNIDREPVDAQVATFDFASRSFTFTQDAQGKKLDGDALYQKIVAALDARNYTAVIAMESDVLTPTVTRVELMNSFALVSSFTTETTSSQNRNSNINLAANAISGTVVMPGETFSFNQATGQRTTEKGYLPAAAIAGGATVDEVGGGVCQVSSTLFNAAAMAGLTILTRYPHTWPSNYVDKGRDATVNWPNLDFTFRNDKTTPVFIVAYYQNRKCTVEIYGATLGAGESIQLVTQLISQTDPPAEPLYEQNPLLAPGTMQEKKKARTGYVVDTYKVYLRNGAEYKREKLCTSTYKMIQQVIEYN